MNAATAQALFTYTPVTGGVKITGINNNANAASALKQFMNGGTGANLSIRASRAVAAVDMTANHQFVMGTIDGQPIVEIAAGAMATGDVLQNAGATEVFLPEGLDTIDPTAFTSDGNKAPVAIRVPKGVLDADELGDLKAEHGHSKAQEVTSLSSPNHDDWEQGGVVYETSPDPDGTSRYELIYTPFSGHGDGRLVMHMGRSGGYGDYTNYLVQAGKYENGKLYLNLPAGNSAIDWDSGDNVGVGTILQMYSYTGDTEVHSWLTVTGDVNTKLRSAATLYFQEGNTDYTSDPSALDSVTTWGTPLQYGTMIALDAQRYWFMEDTIEYWYVEQDVKIQGTLIGDPGNEVANDTEGRSFGSVLFVGGGAEERETLLLGHGRRFVETGQKLSRGGLTAGKPSILV